MNSPGEARRWSVFFSEPPNVDRQWAAEAFEHGERDARSFFDQPQILGTNAGLVKEAIGLTIVTRHEAVSFCGIEPSYSARRLLGTFSRRH